MKFGRIDVNYAGFDWDAFNLIKVYARVPIEIIEELFKVEIFIRQDERRSYGETRFVAMGEINGRILFAAYTIRFKNDLTFIRVISARYVHMNSKEQELYEKAKEIFKFKK